MVLLTEFWIVLFASAAVFWLLPRRWRLGFLSAVSIALLCTLAWQAAAGLAIWVLLFWFAAGRGAGRELPRRRLTLVLVVAALGQLAWFKYLPPLVAALSGNPLEAHVVVPLGMSFFTFKLVHYAIEVGRGEIGQHGFFGLRLLHVPVPDLHGRPDRALRSLPGESGGALVLGVHLRGPDADRARADQALPDRRGRLPAHDPRDLSARRGRPEREAGLGLAGALVRVRGPWGFPGNISDNGTIVCSGFDAASGSSGVVVLTPSSCSSAVVYCTAKINSQGCLPAIAASGLPSAGDPAPFDVTAANVLNQKNGLLFFGVSGRAALPFQGGTLCAQPPLARTAIQSSGGGPPPDDCSGSHALDFNELIQSGAWPQLVPGAQVNGQYWARDPAIGDGSGASLTDAVEFTVCS